MATQDIADFKDAWKQSLVRANEAGFDVVEVHAAHGYALHNYLSPLSNHRTDNYGGSLENRMRLLLEVAEMTRTYWPAEKPVFVRISATDYGPSEKNEDGSYASWGIEQSIILAKRLQELKIDFLDVSSGGNYEKQTFDLRPGYQVPFADAIRKAVPGLLVGSVGLITSGAQANEIVETGKADAVLLAREFLRQADFVFNAAQGELMDLCYR